MSVDIVHTMKGVMSIESVVEYRNIQRMQKSWCLVPVMHFFSHGSEGCCRGPGAGIISSATVENAMLAVDRGSFASKSAYQDSPQLIGIACPLCAVTKSFFVAASQLMRASINPDASHGGDGVIIADRCSLIAGFNVTISAPHMVTCFEYATHGYRCCAAMSLNPKRKSASCDNI